MDTKVRKAHNPEILALKKASAERNVRVLAMAIAARKVSKRSGDGPISRPLRVLD